MGMKRLSCIDLDIPSLEGFRQFISSWLYQEDAFTILVDPGPLSTIERLRCRLNELEVTRLDYILLTHIHIDHAGGTGALLREFPEATVICHPEGIRHLVRPEKLWEGSRKVLGTLADAYGEIIAIPEERIRFQESVGGRVRSFLTPGHAQHHCSFLLDDLLFAGEVAGVRCDIPGVIFMRPATPPRFILQVALDSIDRMIKLAPRRMVFAHYGMVEDAPKHLEIARKQLLLWVSGVAGIPLSENRESLITEWLIQHDGCYRNVMLLPPDIRSREHYFLGNTLRGMAEFVDGLTSEERERLIERCPSGI